jgi:hypothetical protein
MLTKWLGVIEATVVLGGLGGLFTGMYLLENNPVLGVLLMLASMALLLSSVEKLCEMQEARLQSGTGSGRYSRSRAGGSGS